MQMPSPGWYPDPSSPTGTRYWDGAAWTEHTVAATTPTFTVEPARRSSGALVAVLVVLALLVLVGGGLIALLFVARGDDADVQPSSSTVVIPTTAPTAPTAGGVPGGQATDAADAQTCATERATMTTAIEAAKVSSSVSGEVETPDTFLNDPGSFRFYTWTGNSPDEWTLQPIGSPPC